MIIMAALAMSPMILLAAVAAKSCNFCGENVDIFNELQAVKVK